jgi:hypothetical protein
MSVGQGSIKVYQKRQAIPAPPAPTVTGANNGVSLSATNVQLGQDVGAAGDPAALLNSREVPLAGFDFALGSVGSRKLFINNAAGLYFFGDVDDSANGLKFIVGDSFSTFLMSSAVENFFSIDAVNRRIVLSFSMIGLEMDETVPRAVLGDTQQINNGNILVVDDAASLIEITNNALNAVVRINGVAGFTGTVTPVTTITVNGGIVTNVA